MNKKCNWTKQIPKEEMNGVCCSHHCMAPLPAWAQIQLRNAKWENGVEEICDLQEECRMFEEEREEKK